MSNSTKISIQKLSYQRWHRLLNWIVHQRQCRILLKSWHINPTSDSTNSMPQLTSSISKSTMMSIQKSSYQQWHRLLNWIVHRRRYRILSRSWLSIQILYQIRPILCQIRPQYRSRSWVINHIDFWIKLRVNIDVQFYQEVDVVVYKFYIKFDHNVGPKVMDFDYQQISQFLYRYFEGPPILSWMLFGCGPIPISSTNWGSVIQWVIL